MEKEKFISNFFRIIAVLTPLLMLVKGMIDKQFIDVTSEAILFSIYVMLIVFLLGFMVGNSTKKQ
jgi:hypothetical protein